MYRPCPMRLHVILTRIVHLRARAFTAERALPAAHPGNVSGTDDPAVVVVVSPEISAALEQLRKDLVQSEGGSGRGGSRTFT